MNMKIAGRQFLQAWKIGRVVTESNRAIWCFFFLYLIKNV